MINPSILIFAILLTSISMGNTQNLSSHQWNDRLVIILAQDEANQLFKDQIAELRNSVDGLNERRIVVYQSLPRKYRKGLTKEGKWETSGKMFEKLKESDVDFEIILIGLDGGIKLRKIEILKCDELFGVIDQMPMRKYETKNPKKQ